MDCVNLLRRAEDAGLKVDTDGETLSVTGPRRSESLAREILSHKRAVIAHVVLEEQELAATQRTADKTFVRAHVDARRETPLTLARNAVEILGGELLDIDPSRLDLDEPHSLEANRRRIHQYPQSRRSQANGTK